MKFIYTHFHHLTILFFLLFLYSFICASSYTQTVSTNISNSVYRLHIIANSDSYEDQELKLKIRDEILNYADTIIKPNMNKSSIESILQDNIDTLYSIAYNVIEQNGFDYTVNISFGNFYFPTKSYGDVSLPAGHYDGIRIEIGKAIGHNWWCVMFPPLCFTNPTSGFIPEESKEQLRSSIPKEEYCLITNASQDIQFKFKIVELINSSTLLNSFR